MQSHNVTMTEGKGLQRVQSLAEVEGTQRFHKTQGNKSQGHKNYTLLCRTSVRNRDTCKQLFNKRNMSSLLCETFLCGH